MTSLPSVFITGPVRARPEGHQALEAFVSGLLAQDYAGPIEFGFVHHQAKFGQEADDQVAEILWRLSERDDTRVDVQALVIPAPPDSRKLGGARHSGEIQEILAFLRNRCLQAFRASGADLCLMVDSDIELAPNALSRAVEEMQTRELCTVSLQIDNRIAEDHIPAPNAMHDCRRGTGNSNVNPFALRRSSWAEDGSVIEVAQSGACTLYPRGALGYRFRWDHRRHTEEHQGLFDDMREAGCRHWLLRDPSLATHHMRRDPPLAVQRREIQEARA